MLFNFGNEIEKWFKPDQISRFFMGIFGVIIKEASPPTPSSIYLIFEAGIF